MKNILIWLAIIGLLLIAPPLIGRTQNDSYSDKDFYVLLSGHDDKKDQIGPTLLSGENASVSMDCSSIASVHTREVKSPDFGPEAVVTFLRIFSGDAHSKDHDLCQAEYELIILPFAGQSAEIVRLLTSVGNWGRRLTAHIDGFSRDGKQIFGVISEAGGYGAVFGYNRTTGRSSLIDLKDAAKNLRSAKCGTGFAVAGTTKAGGIVLVPRTTDQCREGHRWLLDLSTGRLQPQQGNSFETLYGVLNTQ